MNRRAVLVVTFSASVLLSVHPLRSAAIDMGPEEIIQANGIDVQVPGYSVPSFEDWNNDGLRDLIIGYGDGKIHLYRGLPKGGDLDGDGDIDGDDFTILAKALDQPVPAGGSPCDLNHDGVVDTQDLRVFAELWLAEHK